jgi:hypothetical protein
MPDDLNDAADEFTHQLAHHLHGSRSGPRTIRLGPARIIVTADPDTHTFVIHVWPTPRVFGGKRERLLRLPADTADPDTAADTIRQALPQPPWYRRLLASLRRL